MMKQLHIDWLLSQGVPADAIVKPTPISLAFGHRASDGRFEEDSAGRAWFVFEEPRDTVFWQPKSGEVATDLGSTFALNETLVFNPGATALGQWLNIFASPLSWLRHNRNGIVVLKWNAAFEYLRNVERVAVEEAALTTYKRSMRPRLPALAVLPKSQSNAA